MRNQRNQRRLTRALALASMAAAAFGLQVMTYDPADCVIISPYGTVLTDPVIGEDTGAVYCPTGEWSN